MRMGSDFALVGDWYPGSVHLYTLNQNYTFERNLTNTKSISTTGLGDFEYVQAGNQSYLFTISPFQPFQVYKIDTKRSPYFLPCQSLNLFATSITVDFDYKFLYLINKNFIYRLDIALPCNATLLHTYYQNGTIRDDLGPYAAVLSNGHLFRSAGNNLTRLQVQSRNMNAVSLFTIENIVYFRSAAASQGIGFAAVEQTTFNNSIYAYNYSNGQILAQITRTSTGPVYSGFSVGIHAIGPYLLLVDKEQIENVHIIRVFDFSNPKQPQVVALSSLSTGSGMFFHDVIFAHQRVYTLGLYSIRVIQDPISQIMPSLNSSVANLFMNYFAQRNTFKYDNLQLVNNKVLIWDGKSAVISLTSDYLQVQNQGMNYDFVPAQYQLLQFIKNDAFIIYYKTEKRQWFLQSEIDQGLISIHLKTKQLIDPYYQLFLKVWNGRGSEMQLIFTLIIDQNYASLYAANNSILQSSFSVIAEIPETSLALSLTDETYFVKNVYYEYPFPITVMENTQTDPTGNILETSMTFLSYKTAITAAAHTTNIENMDYKYSKPISASQTPHLQQQLTTSDNLNIFVIGVIFVITGIVVFFISFVGYFVYRRIESKKQSEITKKAAYTTSTTHITSSNSQSGQ